MDALPEMMTLLLTHCCVMVEDGTSSSQAEQLSLSAALVDPGKAKVTFPN